VNFLVPLVAMQAGVAWADQPPPALRTEFAFEARVKVDRPVLIGESSHGLRRIVPILGGPVKGPAMNGNVIAGGADWQYVRSDGAWELDARYTVQTDDGVLIMVENRGVRYIKPEVMNALRKVKRWTRPDLLPHGGHLRSAARQQVRVDEPHAVRGECRTPARYGHCAFLQGRIAMKDIGITYRGVVHQWHCDHMGHMNVMWFVGKFDEATWNLGARWA
jgi:hypothetical protein